MPPSVAAARTQPDSELPPGPADVAIPVPGDTGGGPEDVAAPTPADEPPATAEPEAPPAEPRAASPAFDGARVPAAAPQDEGVELPVPVDSAPVLAAVEAPSFEETPAQEAVELPVPVDSAPVLAAVAGPPAATGVPPTPGPEAAAHAPAEETAPPAPAQPAPVRPLAPLPPEGLDLPLPVDSSPALAPVAAATPAAAAQEPSEELDLPVFVDAPLAREHLPGHDDPVLARIDISVPLRPPLIAPVAAPYDELPPVADELPPLAPFPGPASGLPAPFPTLHALQFPSAPGTEPPHGTPAVFDLPPEGSWPGAATSTAPEPTPRPRPVAVVAVRRQERGLPVLAWVLAAAWLGVLAGAWHLALHSPRPPPAAPPPPPAPPPVYARLDTPLPLPPGEGTFAPLPALPPRIVVRGGGKLPKVALTFDACSTPRFVGWDPRVAHALERYEVPATFFLGGRMVDELPDVVRLLAENPRFELQGHTYLHPHLTEIPADRVVSEMGATDRALYQATGRRAVMFRPPFGEYSTEVVRAATHAGYLPVQYDVASGDPDPGFHPGKLLESVLTQVRAGSIVVLHANGHGVHTPEALPLLIEALRGRGYELTTVSDVLADGNWVVDDGRKGPRPKQARAVPPPPGAPPRVDVDLAAEAP